MIAMRRAAWTMLSIAVLVGALACGVVALLLFSYMSGPLEPQDGTCIGGQSGWAWLQLTVAAVPVVAGGASVVTALSGRVPRAALAVAAATDAVWFVLVLWAIPDAGSVC